MAVPLVLLRVIGHPAQSVSDRALIILGQLPLEDPDQSLMPMKIPGKALQQIFMADGRTSHTSCNLLAHILNVGAILS